MSYARRAAPRVPLIHAAARNKFAMFANPGTVIWMKCPTNLKPKRPRQAQSHETEAASLCALAPQGRPVLHIERSARVVNHCRHSAVELSIKGLNDSIESIARIGADSSILSSWVVSSGCTGVRPIGKEHKGRGIYAFLRCGEKVPVEPDTSFFQPQVIQEVHWIILDVGFCENKPNITSLRPAGCIPHPLGR